MILVSHSYFPASNNIANFIHGRRIIIEILQKPSPGFATWADVALMIADIAKPAS
jgi:hypothetical protein